MSKSDKYGVAPQLALVAMSVVLALALIEYSPLQKFHQWGTQLRISDVGGPQSGSITYQLVGDYLDKGITLEVTKGSAMRWPQFAAWMETEDGDFIQPLYVSRSVANNRYDNTVTKIDSTKRLSSNSFELSDSEFSEVFNLDSSTNRGKTRFRRESLPIFLHKLKGDGDSDRALAPTETEALDGFTGATITEHFIVSRSLPERSLGKVKIFFEVNQSFDFNEYYSSDRFPDDPVYSGDGFSAQPSVIYSADVDLTEPGELAVMKLVGRGHHSGANGNIYTDTEHLTSALNIVKRILVGVN